MIQENFLYKGELDKAYEIAKYINIVFYDNMYSLKILRGGIRFENEYMEALFFKLTYVIHDSWINSSESGKGSNRI